MTFFKFSLCALICLFSHVATATEVVLTSMLSEPENNLVHQVVLGLNDAGVIENVMRKTPEKNEQEVFPVAQLISGEIVLAKSSGRDIIMLGCNANSVCDPSVGGVVKLRFLSNGIWNSYHSILFTLSKTSGEWKLYTESAEPVQSLRLVANKVFGKTIGVDVKVNQ